MLRSEHHQSVDMSVISANTLSARKTDEKTKAVTLLDESKS